MTQNESSEESAECSTDSPIPNAIAIALLGMSAIAVGAGPTMIQAALNYEGPLVQAVVMMGVGLILILGGIAGFISVLSPVYQRYLVGGSR